MAFYKPNIILMEMVNISYAITVCDEAAELERLLSQLVQAADKNDEFVIQADQNNVTQEVLDVISSFEGKYNGKDSRVKKQKFNIIKTLHNLDGDFSQFKNNVKDKCTKDYVFFIDADEEVTTEQISTTKQILEMNPDFDCYLVPRINTVEGLTDKHINEWRWNVNEKGWINFPDYQYRICKNIEQIKWVNKVHERLEGYTRITMLPDEPVLVLGHHKTIKKQEKQNNFYNTL